MTLLTLSYKKSKMRAILGSIVYILILSIRRKAIKKIENFFYNYGLFLFPILFLLSFSPFYIVLYTKYIIQSILIFSYSLYIRYLFVNH